MEARGYWVPRPRLRLVRWLQAPVHFAGHEVDDELRASMFRRIEAVVASAVVTLIIVVLAARDHSTFEFQAWLVIETALFVVRVPLAIHIISVRKQFGPSRCFHPWAVDLFVIAGTIWSAALGFGCFISLKTQDPGLSVLVSLLAMGTASAQSTRNPSSPRLSSVQMCLIIFPFIIGTYCSNIPLVGWCFLLVPLYVAGMLSITLQIHEDYVTMIVARIEDRRRALHCALTGLPNRVFFNDSLALRLEKAIATKERIAVFCLDLDGFKAVNDEFGHPVGDVLLQQVADRLRGVLQGDEMAARLGGDEFAVLVGGNCDLGAAKGLASRVVAALAQPFALTAQHTARIGVSVGIVMVAGGSCKADFDKPAELLAQADQALYVAKRQGRNTFRIFGDTVTEADIRACRL